MAFASSPSQEPRSLADYPLRVAVETSALRRERTGVGRYVEQLLAHMAPEHVAWVRLSNRGADACGRIRRPTLAWLQVEVPRRLRRAPLDLAHFPTGRAPVCCPIPYVLTVHDVSVLTMGHLYPRREQVLVAPWLVAAARRAAAIIAVSRDTAHAVQGHLGPGLPPIHVIPEAAAPSFSARVPPETIRAVRGRHGIPERYWLHVGSITTRKNLPRLLAAFGAVRDRVGAPAPALILVGPRGNASGAVQRWIADAGLANAVRITGYVPEATLAALYAGAELVAIPSLHEGCGLPALEAMAAGRPVLSSGRGGLGEAPTGGSLHCDPESVAGIALGLATLGASPEIRVHLGAAGRAAAERYRWSDAAARTADVYASILRGLGQRHPRADPGPPVQ